MNEFEILNNIRSYIPESLKSEDKLLDDAAILKASSNGKALLTTDVLVEGVDFIRSQSRAQWVGRKSLNVSLSDIAAMGGSPHACVISLGLPKNISKKWVREFYKGFVAAAKKNKTLCVGGDISMAKEIFISVAILGYSKTPITRSGAKSGDWIGVTGTLGGSILNKHFMFEPRLKEAEFLARYHLNSMMDISDGFVQDLEHILSASQVGAEIYLEEIPISKDAMKLTKGNLKKARQRALSEGEDFELLFTLSDLEREKVDRLWKKNFRNVGLSWVGKVQKKTKKIVWLDNNKIVKSPVGKKKGYTHSL